MRHVALGQRLRAVLGSRARVQAAGPHQQFLARVGGQPGPRLARAHRHLDVTRIGVGVAEDPGGTVRRPAGMAQPELLEQQHRHPARGQRAGGSRPEQAGSDDRHFHLLHGGDDSRLGAEPSRMVLSGR